MASIYRQKGSKNWWVKVYEPGNPKPKRFSLETDNEDAARDKLRKIEAKQTLDQPIEPKADRLRFSQLAAVVVNDYIFRKNRSLETLKSRFWYHIIPFFGQHLVRNIRTAEIEQYIAKRMEQWNRCWPKNLADDAIIAGGRIPRSGRTSVRNANREIGTCHAAASADQ